MPILLCDFCGKSFKRRNSPRYARSFCDHVCESNSKRTGYIVPKGYRAFKVGGKRRYAHTIIMESYLGRELGADETVHHIDGDKLNNSISNLRVVKRADHAREHNPLTWSIETAQSLLAEGRTIRQVAEACGVKAPAIRGAFRRRGLSLPVGRTSRTVWDTRPRRK
jgi:hypothetical protein